MKFYEFDIEEQKKSVKYLRLKISANGDISLNIPLFCSQKRVNDFLKANLAWLRKTSQKIKEKPQKTQNEIEFLAQKYELVIDKASNIVDVGLFSIVAPNKKELQIFLDNKAKELINNSISHFAPLIDKKINRVSFKHMKTRWGSCNHKKAYLNFNLNLISKSIDFIEYVVLHELAHLVYPHHKKEFYDLIEKFMPDYKIRLKNAENSQF